MSKQSSSSSKSKSKVIITPEAIASYPNIAKPRQNDDGNDRWGMALVFPKGTDLKAMKAEAMRVLRANVDGDAKDVTKAVKAGKLHWPFRDDADDVAEKGYPEGSTFLNASSTRAVGTVSRVPDSEGRPSVIDPESIYPGCIVKASVDAYYFERKGNKGVTFGLRNVQFIKDGERLDSVTHAQDDFEADPNAAADLDDMESEASDANEDEDGDEDGEDEDDLSDLL